LGERIETSQVKNIVNTFTFISILDNSSNCYDFDISFNKLLLQKEELEQRHLHLLQVVESEMTAKWQYTQQCEELATEIKKLRAEVINYKIIL
jgi:hypothetical protein